MKRARFATTHQPPSRRERRFSQLVIGTAMMVTCLAGMKCKKPESDKPSAPSAQTQRSAPATANRPQPASLTLDLGKGVNVKFVRIAPGTFTMGAPGAERGRGGGQTPHQVTLIKVFYIAVNEVTQEQYQAVMGDNPSHFKGDKDLPVERVSWDDAVTFCRKLSQMTGKKLRLPTEAEWEYVCRAGSNGPYGELEKMGWFRANSGDKTHPIGTKSANAWGLNDVHGNVSEWCSDWYEGDYLVGNATDPTGPGSGSQRIVRGGSWADHPRTYRNAIRAWVAPDVVANDVGFRLAMEPD